MRYPYQDYDQDDYPQDGVPSYGADSLAIDSATGHLFLDSHDDDHAAHAFDVLFSLAR